MIAAVLGLVALSLLLAGIDGLLVRSVLKRADASAGIMRERDVAVSERLAAEATRDQHRKDADALREQLDIMRADLEQARDDLDGCSDPAVVRARLQRLFVVPKADDGSSSSDGPVPSWVTADPAADPVDD